MHIIIFIIYIYPYFDFFANTYTYNNQCFEIKFQIGKCSCEEIFKHEY